MRDRITGGQHLRGRVVIEERRRIEVCPTWWAVQSALGTWMLPDVQQIQREPFYRMEVVNTRTGRVIYRDNQCADSLAIVVRACAEMVERARIVWSTGIKQADVK